MSTRLLVIDEGGRMKIFPFVVLDRKIMKKRKQSSNSRFDLMVKPISKRCNVKTFERN
jgi:hypothetical protein